MVDHPHKRLRADLAFPDPRVAVLPGSPDIHAVIQMDRFQAFQPHNTVKLCQHTVKIIHNVIPGIPDMACIHTYSHLIRKFDSVKNFPKLLKASSDLAALSRHGLQEHRGVKLRLQDLIQHLCDIGDPNLHALLHMAPRMEIVEISGNRLHPFQVIRHGPLCEIPDLFVGGTAV